MANDRTVAELREWLEVRYNNEEGFFTRDETVAYGRTIAKLDLLAAGNEAESRPQSQGVPTDGWCLDCSEGAPVMRSPLGGFVAFNEDMSALYVADVREVPFSVIDRLRQEAAEPRPQSQGVPTVTREHEKSAFAVCANIVSGYSDIPAGLMSDVCDALAYQIAQKEAAYERGRSQAAGDGWVSVDERLPKCGEPQLMYLSRKNIVRQGFRTSGKLWFLDDGDPAPAVTHWRPLPAPPSDSGKRE